jgi:hypothetical protein
MFFLTRNCILTVESSNKGQSPDEVRIAPAIVGGYDQGARASSPTKISNLHFRFPTGSQQSRSCQTDPAHLQHGVELVEVVPRFFPLQLGEERSRELVEHVPRAHEVDGPQDGQLLDQLPLAHEPGQQPRPNVVNLQVGVGC